MISSLKNFVLVLLVVTIVNSHSDPISTKDLKQLEEALHESSVYMERKAKDENIAICIGTTRAGKSTLVNYLIGNPLIAEQLGKFKPITISQTDNSTGPAIGSGSTSKTTIPSRWISKKIPKMSLWDAPGFDDTRGPIQDITNAFYLYQLFQKVKSVKIILVVDINDIAHDNIKPFLSVLTALENLMRNKMKDNFKSISVIFSKVPNTLNDVPVDMEFLNELLHDQFLTSSAIAMSQISKDFIQFLISNNKYIGLFRRASKVGPITSDIDVNIFSAINNSVPMGKVLLKEISPSISDTSKLYLFKARKTLFSIVAFKELQNVITRTLDNKVLYFRSVSNNRKVTLNKINEIRGSLINIKKKLSNALVINVKNFQEKVKILQSIDVSIKKKVEEHNLLEKIKLIEFVDKLLHLQESNGFKSNLQTVLSYSISKANECINFVQLKAEQVRRQEYNDELSRMKKIREDELKKLSKELEEKKKKKSDSTRKWFWVAPLIYG